ncbi:MAG: hypothetical protein RLZZ440_2255 [Planctomycetota bacterium]
MSMDRVERGRGGPAMGRTAAFLAGGLALLAVGGWLQLQPKLRYREPAAEATAAKLLFPELSDASKAASLEIVSFDEDTATLIPFKVVKAGGVWVLPAQQNYPADAKDQLAAAATELIDRPILDVVSTSPGDHEVYGVIEPDAEKVEVGATGVGQLVEIRDASGNKLARLIVGKEDKRPGGGGAAGRTLRFVRKAGQDPVYRVELDTTKFTTKFDDWIEKDLLKLSPWDVRRLTIDDSTCSFEVDPGSGGLAVSQDRKSLIELAYDDREAKWSLLKLTEFGPKGEAEEKSLAAGEELASSRLNDLRNALGDLSIVDVVRKPTGLSADLKAEEAFTGDQEAVLSLAQRGFFPFQSGEILSSSGETVIGMKDGVEYLLRFGNATSVTASGDAAEGEDESAAATNGRYLFVLARLNESLLERPEPKPLPEVPAVPAENAPDQAEEEAAAADNPDGEAAAETAAADEEEGAGDGSAAEALAQADEVEAKAQAALEERRRIERENRLAQEEYEEKLAAAKKRVRELNNRFADWYYVVSDEEYAKIRLSRTDVIQATPADEAAPASEPAP